MTTVYLYTFSCDRNKQLASSANWRLCSLVQTPFTISRNRWARVSLCRLGIVDSFSAKYLDIFDASYGGQGPLSCPFLCCRHINTPISHPTCAQAAFGQFDPLKTKQFFCQSHHSLPRVSQVKNRSKVEGKVERVWRKLISWSATLVPPLELYYQYCLSIPLVGWVSEFWMSFRGLPLREHNCEYEAFCQLSVATCPLWPPFSDQCPWRGAHLF